jgi:hypothetical protein
MFQKLIIFITGHEVRWYARIMYDIFFNLDVAWKWLLVFDWWAKLHRMECNKKSFFNPLLSIDKLIFRYFINPSNIFGNNNVLINENASVFNEHLQSNQLLHQQISISYQLRLLPRTVTGIYVSDRPF